MVNLPMLHTCKVVIRPLLKTPELKWAPSLLQPGLNLICSNRTSRKHRLSSPPKRNPIISLNHSHLQCTRRWATLSMACLEAWLRDTVCQLGKQQRQWQWQRRLVSRIIKYRTTCLECQVVLRIKSRTNEGPDHLRSKCPRCLLQSLCHRDPQ